MSLALALVPVTGGGCTMITTELGRPIPVERVELKEGATSASQVVEALGPPLQVSALPDGMVMVYEYVNATERQLGVNLEFLGLDWFKLSLGRAGAKHDVLLLIFDGNGVLQAEDSQKRTEDLGTGFGFQLFFVAAPTVDTSYLDAAPDQLNWGRAALKPLPVTLNNGQSITSGLHGIEMRGTPDSVGQRALEMHRDN